MSLVGKIIKDNIVDPAFRSYTITMMCMIVKINGSADTISVQPVTSRQETQETEDTTTSDLLEDISILNSGTLKDGKPNRGDYVYLSFIDHELTNAILIALIRPKDPNQDDTSKTEEQSESTKAGEINYDIFMNLNKSLATSDVNENPYSAPTQVSIPKPSGSLQAKNPTVSVN